LKGTKSFHPPPVFDSPLVECPIETDHTMVEDDEMDRIEDVEARQIRSENMGSPVNPESARRQLEAVLTKQ
jgi:hypothetical protein